MYYNMVVHLYYPDNRFSR